ncbi:MAG: FAD binding domain-containing protein, partial [Rhodomicrobium sp.]
MRMPAEGFDVVHPRTVLEALEFYSRGDCRFVAGGTALQLEWAAGLPQPERLVNLGGVAGLKSIVCGEDQIQIGALLTLAALERHPGIATKLPLLASAIRTVAAPAIRTLATMGGNVGGRNGCLLPVLLALGAHVQIAGLAGRRQLPL